MKKYTSYNRSATLRPNIKPPLTFWIAALLLIGAVELPEGEPAPGLEVLVPFEAAALVVFAVVESGEILAQKLNCLVQADSWS